MEKVNHTLTDQEILTMRRAILNKNGGYDKVFIPNHLIEYLVSENKTLNWKGQVLFASLVDASPNPRLPQRIPLQLHNEEPPASSAVGDLEGQWQFSDSS